MGFIITSQYLAEAIYPGQIITYKVSPIPGIKLNWCSEITHVRDGQYFVDEQRSGPYKMWHHEHHIRDVEGGLLMTDIIHYSLPFGFIGEIAHKTVCAQKARKDL